jgi:ATP-dependent protease HslVU (ClpYQ) peptidase subunit
MTAELTPFERAELGLVNSSILIGVAGSTIEAMELLTECDAQVNMFKALLNEGADIDEDERCITAQAMQDSRDASQRLIALASLIETKFGISA